MSKKKKPSSGGLDLFTMDKLKRVASPKVIENADMLVDIDYMIKRHKDGSQIFGTITLDFDPANCVVVATRHTLKSDCSCGADYFCSHAAALVLTYLENPESFLDLEAYLDDLQHRSHAELVDMLRRVVGQHPGMSLEALGQPGFLPSEVLEDDPDDDLDFPLEIDDSEEDNPRHEPWKTSRGECDDDCPFCHDDDDDDPDLGGSGPGVN